MSLRKLRTVSALIACSVAMASMVGVAIADGSDPGGSTDECSACHSTFTDLCHTVQCEPGAIGCTQKQDKIGTPSIQAICVYEDEDDEDDGDGQD